MTSKLVEFRPPRIAQFLVVIAVLLHWALPLRIELFSDRALGSITIAIGFCTMMTAWWLFRKQQTAVCPTATPSTLVLEGVYRFTRNPMYLGMTLMLLGLAIIVGSLPFYVAAVAYLVIMDTVFCPYEEEKMLRLFGDEFVHYKNMVRRWL